MRILVADDSNDDQAIVRLAFEQAGVAAELEFVNNGEELLQYLQAGHTHSLESTSRPVPDLLLLDLGMPGRDGFQVLEWLQTRPAFARMPVIVFSGSDQPVDINRALSLGAVRYLVKPQKMPDMVQLVRGIEKFWQKLRANSAAS